MSFSSLLRRPLVWLGIIGLALLGVLGLWQATRPTDANGNDLVLKHRAAADLRRDLTRQAARRHADSLRLAGAETAAAASYHQGLQSQAAAQRLHQQARQAAAPPDTTASQLQRELTNP